MTVDAPAQPVELGDFAGPSCLGPDADPAVLEAFGAALPLGRGIELFRYWLARWRDGLPPRRADILPEELGALLASAFLIEVEPASGRLRFRLMGSELAGRMGYDPSGLYLDEERLAFPEDMRRRQDRRDVLSVAQARPVYSGMTLAHVGRGWGAVASLRLPLIDQGRVSHLLGYGTAV